MGDNAILNETREQQKARCDLVNDPPVVERYKTDKFSIGQVPILSFFTGAGFLDIGFMKAGFDNIVWRNESNPFFVKGFEHGMSSYLNKKGNQGKHCKIDNTKSIVDIKVEEILQQAFLNTEKPKVFGIIGGPPCPDFSVGGKNRGREGDHGKLSGIYIDRILDLEPTFFLMENVPGLLRTEKHQRFLNSLKEKLWSADYALSIKVLNALEFGVPQDRNRLFLVAFKKTWLEQEIKLCVQGKDESWFPWPKPLFPDAKNKYKWPGQSNFGSNPEKPEGIPDELTVHHAISNLENSKLPNVDECFKPHSTKFKTIAEGDDSRKSFKRLHRWRYSPAAAYGNNEVHLHPTQPRRLSVREAMRIQTVPDEYVFPKDMSLTHKFKMIGNGVPVRLAKAVAESFKKVLEGDIERSI